MMPDERAFTRRQPGVNPIASELDRLAEQQALQTLGRGGPAVVEPRNAQGQTQGEERDTEPMASEEEIAAELRAHEVRQALAPFNFEPDDPQWGGLDEDVAHQFWADRLAATAHRYPDMDAIERAAFEQAYQTKGWALPEFPAKSRQ